MGVSQSVFYASDDYRTHERSRSCRCHREPGRSDSDLPQSASRKGQLPCHVFRQGRAKTGARVESGRCPEAGEGPRSRTYGGQGSRCLVHAQADSGDHGTGGNSCPLAWSITEVARQYGHAHKILEGKPLMEAVDFHAKHLAREALHGALAPVTLPDLVKKYFESIDGEKSKRYVQDLQAKLNRAAKAFTGQLRDIRPDDIDGPQRTAALLLLLPYGGDKKRRAGSLGGRKQPEDAFRALSGVGHGSRSQGMVWPQPFCDWQNMKSDKRLSLIFIFDFCIKLSGKMPNI